MATGHRALEIAALMEDTTVSFALGLIAGLIVGAAIGVTIMAIVTAGKFEDIKRGHDRDQYRR
jgi:hypothetical protein